MLRVLDRLDMEPRPLHIYTPLGGWNKSPTHDLGQFFEQHCLGHAGLDVSGLDDKRGAGEDDLGGPLYLDPPAPTRAPVSAHDAPDLPLYAPGEEVLAGNPACRVREQIQVESVRFGLDSDQGGWGEGITLHPVYKQDEKTEVVSA